MRKSPFFGALCSFFCPYHVYLLSNIYRPFYTKGCAIGCALSGLIIIFSLGLHVALRRENKRRDREFGTVDRDAFVDVTELGDKNKNFRYLT